MDSFCGFLCVDWDGENRGEQIEWEGSWNNSARATWCLRRLLDICSPQSLTRDVELLEYVSSRVGILQKLGPFVTELNRPLTQGPEKLKEGPEEGRADAGLTAASCQKVSQEISNNHWELQWGCCFPSTLQNLPRISSVAQPTWKYTRKRNLGNVAQSSQYDAFQSHHHIHMARLSEWLEIQVWNSGRGSGGKGTFGNHHKARELEKVLWGEKVDRE